MRAADNIADVIGGTPLVRLRRISEKSGATVVGKLDRSTRAAASRTALAWR